METLLTREIVPMTKSREPSKVLSLSQANKQPITNRFVPASPIGNLKFTPANSDKVKEILATRRSFISKVLKYLEDK